MKQEKHESEQRMANGSGLTALSQADIEQVAGGNPIPIVAKDGDLVYVGPKEPMALDLEAHLGLKDLRKPDYLYQRR
jgi:hypothetical protein